MGSRSNGGTVTSRDISSTFVKGMQVLKAFNDVNTKMSLAEISEITGLDRATVRRLVLTLVHMGYVEKVGRHFSLRPHVLVLAGGFIRGNRIHSHVQPLMNRFAAILGTTISLSVADGEEVVLVAQSKSDNSDRAFGFTVGSRVPILNTAIGRTLLAFGDPDWSKDVVDRAELNAYTSASILDRDVVRAQIDKARADGYAVVKGEYEAGLAGVSVPVGPIGTVEVVLGVSVPSASVATDTDVLNVVSVMQQCAAEFERSKIFTS